MAPELPYLLAGGIAVIGGFTREGKWPDKGTEAILATVALTTVASLTANTAGAPLVAGIGWLLVLTAVYTSVPAFDPKNQKKV